MQIQEIVEGKELTDVDFEGSVLDLLTAPEREQMKHHMGKSDRIKDYWLRCLKEGHATSQEIHLNDEPILKHLAKVESGKEEGKLWLKFHFDENEWFKNAVLAKYFDVKDDEILKTYGDKIDWNEGKNVTVKTVKSKKKGKSKKVSVKEVKEESFFHLFTDIDMQKEEDNEDHEIDLAETQYEVAEEIHEEVVLKSLQFYLGVGMGPVQDIEEGDSDASDSSEEEHEKGHKKVRHSRCRNTNLIGFIARAQTIKARTRARTRARARTRRKKLQSPKKSLPRKRRLQRAVVLPRKTSPLRRSNAINSDICSNWLHSLVFSINI